MNHFIGRIDPVSQNVAGRVVGTYQNSQFQTLMLVTISTSNGWADVPQGSTVLVMRDHCVFVEEHGAHEDEIGEFVFVPIKAVLGTRKTDI